MIDGFRIEVTADEVGRHLETRIGYHHGRVQECEAKLTRLRALDGSLEDEEEGFEMCASSRVHGLERMSARHRAREVFLIFARNHIVANEIYRLSDVDLQVLEWLPGEESGVMVGRF
jgi:hypothetical protein